MMFRFFILAGAVILSARPAFAASEAGGLFGWLTDPTTNVAALALAIFLLIAWRMGAFRAITSTLDSRADNIQRQLSEAKKLREEAAKALAEAERRQREADDQAEATIEQAKADADALIKAAQADLEQRMARRQAQAEARISRAEAEASAEVRRAAADAATRAAASILAADESSDYFERAASEIEKSLS